MPAKSEMGSTLRSINTLIRDVEIIEAACGGKKDAGADKLDDFQKNKADLGDLIKIIKDDVKIARNMEERMGKNAEVVKLKQKINREIDTAKSMHSKMEAAYEINKAKEGTKNGLDADELESREELVKLFRQDLDYTENDYKPKPQGNSRGFQLARESREKRRQKREQGLMSSEPQPLTSAQQNFIQESIEKDKVLDEKLDVIKQGVKQLGMIAYDINQELDKQAVMMDEIEEKMDDLQDKLETKNEQMKKLLAATGGAQRWCPIMILFVIFLALLGYIYNQIA